MTWRGLAALVAAGFGLLALSPHAEAQRRGLSGCCSKHKGVAGCSLAGGVVCNDGTASPTCTCEHPVAWSIQVNDSLYHSKSYTGSPSGGTIPMPLGSTMSCSQSAPKLVQGARVRERFETVDVTCKPLLGNPVTLSTWCSRSRHDSNMATMSFSTFGVSVAIGLTCVSSQNPVVKKPRPKKQRRRY